MIRIDAHHHLWELARRPHVWLDGPTMAPIRRDFTLNDLAAPARPRESTERSWSRCFPAWPRRLSSWPWRVSRI